MKRASLLAFFALLVSLPPQAANAAQTVRGPARFDREIAAYEQHDLTNPPPRAPLLFTGASSIRRWTTLARDFPGQPVLNRGFGGSEIADATYFAERIIFPYQPRMLFLRAGGNDLWAGKSPEQVLADFKAFVSKIRSRFPETDIVFISLCPSIARWKQVEKEKALNALIQDYVGKTPHLKYADVWSVPLGADGRPRPEIFVADKLHFSPEGYKLMAERVRPFLPSPGKQASK